MTERKLLDCIRWEQVCIVSWEPKGHYHKWEGDFELLISPCQSLFSSRIMMLILSYFHFLIQSYDLKINAVSCPSLTTYFELEGCIRHFGIKRTLLPHLNYAHKNNKIVPKGPKGAMKCRHANKTKSLYAIYGMLYFCNSAFLVLNWQHIWMKLSCKEWIM